MHLRAASVVLCLFYATVVVFFSTGHHHESGSSRDTCAACVWATQHWADVHPVPPMPAPPQTLVLLPGGELSSLIPFFYSSNVSRAPPFAGV